MDRNGTLELVRLMRVGLLETIKHQIIDDIVQRHLAAAEAELRDTLRETLEQATLGTVEAWKDMIGIRNVLEVEFKWEVPDND